LIIKVLPQVVLRHGKQLKNVLLQFFLHSMHSTEIVQDSTVPSSTSTTLKKKAHSILQDKNAVPEVEDVAGRKDVAGSSDDEQEPEDDVPQV
jgi:hypothetical protein